MKPQHSSHRILAILFFAFLAISVFVALRLAGQRQDTRNRAAGLGTAIGVSLEPAVRDVLPGASVDFKIMLKNISGVNQSILGANAQITFPADKLKITDPACAASPSPLSNKAVALLAGNTLELGCYKDVGTSAYIMVPNDQIVFGTFHGSVAPEIATGTVISIAFNSQDVPIAGTLTNLAEAGKGANLTVVAASVATPTATPTPAVAVEPPITLTPTTCPDLPAPANLLPVDVATMSANGTVRITWDPVPGALRYAIRINDTSTPWCDPPGSECQNPNYPNCTKYEGDRCDESVSNTFYDATLQANHTYHIWVHGFNNCGVIGPGNTGNTIFVNPAPTETPTATPTPTTIASQCLCVANNFCDPTCNFDKVTGNNISYAPQFRCSYAFSSPTQSIRNSWCRRPPRGKGDAQGDDKVNLVDYDYYRRTVLLDTGIPAEVNADFSGDGEVGTVDGTIVLTTLGLVGIPTPTPVSTTVSDNFDGASIDSNKWGLWRSGSSTRVEQKNGKTEFEFLGASTAYRSGELWGKQIWGDFVASVDVSRISGGLPTGSDAHLVFRDVRDWDNSLQMFVRVESSNSVSIISGYVLSEQWTELNRKTFPGLGPFTLRIKRTGSNAKWEIKEGNSFVELASASDVFKGPGIVMLQSNSWEPGFPAALSTFDNFSVEGSQSNACLAYPTMDTFTVGKINKELWNIFSWDQNTNVVESDGKLRTAKAGSTNAGQARISSKKQLCGDFDVSVDFDSLTSIAADTSVGSLYVEDAGFASTVQKGSGLYIEMQRNKTGSQHIGTDFWVNDVPSGQYKAVDFPGNSGRLRIRRTGSTYTTYYSDGGTWKQLAQFQSPQLAAPVFLSLGVGSWDPDHPPVSANFDNVNIQSASAVSATAVQSTGINTSVSPPPSINYGTMIQSSAIKHLGN